MITSGFFPDVNGDRLYTNDFLARWVHSFISNGIYNGDFAIKPGENMNVILPTGQAWINGYYCRNDGDVILPVANADGVLKRKDTVVLRWDINTRDITAKVLTGKFASAPVAPPIVRNAEQYDLKLAEISIAAGAISITQSAITDTRLDNKVCGIVHGTVEQVDTTTLYNQIQSDLLQFKSGSEADFSTWSEAQKAAFNAWLEGIKTVLDGDTAGNLLNLINEIKADLDSHTSDTCHIQAGEREKWNGKAEKSDIPTSLPANGGNASTLNGYGTDNSSRSVLLSGRQANTTVGHRSVALGSGTTASEQYSTAMGYETTASASFSTAMGFRTTASENYSTTIGRDNKIVYDLFIIGNGDSSGKANAFRIAYSGEVYGTGSYHSSGADYAEFFEWQDENPDNEDRVGHFVALDGEKIKYANDGDYIVGVVSGTPAIIGDHPSESWKNRYVTDIYGRIQYHEIEIPDVTRKIENEDGTTENVVIIPKHKETQPIINENYDPSKESTYQNREMRPEWAAVGMFGKLVCIDDGSCEVNGYCKPINGIATKADKGYRVMARLDSTHIKVLIK